MNTMENENFDNFDNYELTPEESLMLEKLQQKKLQSLELKVAIKLKELEQTTDNLNKKVTIIQSDFENKTTNLRTELKNDIQNLNNNIFKQTEKNNYVDEKLNDRHVTLTSLGASHSPKINSGHMGDLLRKTGIALKNFSNTTPKSEYTTGKTPMVMNRSFNGYLSYIYHVDRTWKIIKSRLQDADLIFDFENCKTTDEIHDFIKSMNYLV